MTARWTFLLLCAAGCSSRFRVNEAAYTAPNLYLTEVRLSGGKTELLLRYEAAEACEIGVRPPGDAGAFVLRAGDQTYRLLGVSGIAELPSRTAIDAHGSLRFRLRFEPLPEGTTAFAVGEAAFDPGAPGDSWQFPVVDLRAPSVVRRW